MGEPGQPIDRAWLTRHPVEVAWHLIGCTFTVERDGAWYFSPTETLVEYGRLALDLALAQ